MTYSVCETGIPFCAPKLCSDAQKTHFKFSFLYWILTEKYNEVEITNFTVLLINLKRHRRQNCRQKKNNKTKSGQSERRNYLPKCFHSFKYIIDLTNVCLFFLISLWTRSHSLSDIVYTASCNSIFTTCCIFSAQITSQLSQVYSHTNFLFQYILENYAWRAFCNENLVISKMFYKEI